MVVNSWYFTAYEPILSLDGVPIGALYVGMQEVPYTATKVSMGVLYSGVLLLGSLIGLAISWLLGSKLAQPIKALENAVRRVAAGERNLQIQVTSHDEIGSLATEFNQMTTTLEQREEAIQELNRGLEEKVQTRTAELEEKNRLLVQTREELVRAEKLAAVGKLAAGVAHEINNPLAIIRGNVELLQMSIPVDADNREEADTIYQQVGRMERIVANLLSFARQQQKELGQLDLNHTLHEIISQVGHQAPLTGIAVTEQYSTDLPPLAGDEGQLRQVFTNLILNALQAMPDGGTLTVTTTLGALADNCTVIIADTGVGIPVERQQEIFNPFFTTKANGTGLGLSVSYGIVQEHGGTITVQSVPQQGTAFAVTLPLCQSPSTVTS
jgi:two-component system NtrC family sensor kinase